MEKALFRFEVEIMKLCDAENIVNGVLMVSEVGTGSNTNVVHVYADRRTERFVFENDVTVDKVHHSLKRRRRIGESKIHHCRFEKSVSGFKGGFLLVSFADPYVIVTPSYVEFGIDVCIA